MKEYPNKRLLKAWKKFPLRIPGFKKSDCCGVQTICVQSMKGGFVTQNCPECGNKVSGLTEDEFVRLNLWVACPKCGERMDPTRDYYQNYAFECEACDIFIKFASILPNYDDI